MGRRRPPQGRAGRAIDRRTAFFNEARSQPWAGPEARGQELRSPSDRLADLQAKMEQWIANGVDLAWLIDPSRKTVEIYRPGKPMEEQVGHSAVYGEGSVGGFVLELGRIWG